ncbi:hypothetical protein ABZP36_010923 [Zizania latifolia]
MRRGNGGMIPLGLALLLAAALATAVSGQGRPVTDSGAQTPPTPSTFTPKDNFLIDCGGTAPVDGTGGKVYKTDAQSNHLLSAMDAVKIAVDKADVPSPVYLTARIFRDEAIYSFPLTVPGWHFIRLYLFPLENSDFNLATATFTVSTDTNVLLHSFTAENKPVMKEFVVNATENRLAVKFCPLKNSAAFINAIEVVNAPDDLITDTALGLAPVGETGGLSQAAYQVVYRLNVGGPAIAPDKDTLGRQWDVDAPYVQSKEAVKDVSVPPGNINFPDGTSKLVAPALVYASAAKMADASVGSPSFNMSWKMDVDPTFGYLVRLFFADIVSKSMNDLYFNVFVNGRKAISGLDLSTITGELSAAYYKDIVVNSSIATDKLSIQVGPMGEDTGRVDALLSGVEVLKMSNSVGSLDGEFGVDGKKADDGSGGRKAVAAVGFAMMFGAFAGLGAMAVKWHKRPHDWERRNSFSSWLLPIHTGQSFTSGKGGSSKSGYTFSSTLGLGRFFSFAEIQTATNNFEESAIIGVGGFGNVYIGEIDDGTKVAVKRGNPQSEQGINEFNTEIQMLSKLRHRHLLPREQVSLAEWGMQWKRKGLIDKIMDPKLAGTVNQESLNKFAETAEKCLAEYGSDRISMGDVLWNLEYALQMQEANPPEGADQPADDQDAAAPASSTGGSGGVTAVPDASTTDAGELFAQLADMKGR